MSNSAQLFHVTLLLVFVLLACVSALNLAAVNFDPDVAMRQSNTLCEADHDVQNNPCLRSDVSVMRVTDPIKDNEERIVNVSENLSRMGSTIKEAVKRFISWVKKLVKGTNEASKQMSSSQNEQSELLISKAVSNRAVNDESVSGVKAETMAEENVSEKKSTEEKETVENLSPLEQFNIAMKELNDRWGGPGRSFIDVFLNGKFAEWINVLHAKKYSNKMILSILEDTYGRVYRHEAFLLLESNVSKEIKEPLIALKKEYSAKMLDEENKFKNEVKWILQIKYNDNKIKKRNWETDQEEIKAYLNKFIANRQSKNDVQ